MLSSTDEKIAFAIGIIALMAAVFYDGDLDLAPISGAAIVGVIVALIGSFIAPPVVTNEWHVSVIVVLLVIGGAIVVHRRK